MASDPQVGLGERTPKRFRHGTHRLVAPAETVTRVRRLMPVLGITRVANVTGLDRIGIPVVMVCRPNSRSLAVCQGKGLDLAAAEASGLMEAVEHYHAERITLPVKLASYNDLRFRHQIADLAELPRVAVSSFHPDLRLLWIESRDLATGAPVWVPYELVHLNLTLPLPPASGCFPLSSNGLGSGNHRLEATCHGICEVVERDAVTLWIAGGEERRRRTRIDPDSVDDPACRELLARYERADVLVAAWEITSDVGVPAYRCAIFDRAPEPLGPVYGAAGMGCHPTRQVALYRALTEAAQSRLTIISGARDDIGRHDYTKQMDPDAAAAARVELERQAPQRRFHDAPSWESETFEEDLAWLLERLSAAGFPRVLAVDLTQEGLELPVVRVVIPGLEALAWQPGYIPGPRLRALADGEES